MWGLSFRLSIVLVWLVAAICLPKSVFAADPLTVTRQDDPAPDGCAVDDCSLREAIIAANASPDADTITLPAGTYTLTIGGRGEQAAATGDLDVTSTITVVGAGAATTIVDGGGLDRVFEIRGGSLTISGVTVRNGDPGDGNGGGFSVLAGSTLEVSNSVIRQNHVNQNGGGIANSGTLVVTDTTVGENTTATGGTTDQLGGGIANFVGGTMTLIRLTIQNNSAGRQGGGVWNNGVATIAGGTISGNSTPSGTTPDREGGGIANSASGTLTMNDVAVTNNVAGRDGGGVSNGGTLTIDGGTISENATRTGEAVDQNGGGLRNFTQGHLTIQNATVARNTAFRSGGGLAGAGDIQVTNTTFSNNQAGGSGGGVAGFLANIVSVTSRLQLTGVTVSENTSGGSGGGISAFGADLVLTGSVIENNSAAFDGAGVAKGAATSGALSHTSEATIINSQIRGNHGTTSNSDGGGIANLAGPLELRDSIVENNDVGGFGGGIANLNGAVLTTFTGIIRNNTAAVSGGGITQNLSSPSLTLTDTTVTGNTATTGAGGGLIAGAGSVTLLRSTFNANHAPGGASGNGGGLYMASGSTLTVTESTLRDNSSGRDGGGLYNAGTSTLTDTTVSGNQAARYAGGLNNTGSLTLTRVTVSGNAAQTGGGGGVSNSSTATLIVAESTIAHNTTSASGGGILLDSGATLSLKRSTISENAATGTGGGLTFGGNRPGGTGDLIDVTFSANTSGTSGGGLALFGPTVAATNVTFQGNGASQAGAVFVQSGSLGLRNTILANSRGGSCAGPLSSLGNNLEFPGTTCGLSAAKSDLIGVDPQLGPLANNGGPTLTHLPSGNSPAIDAGTSSTCESLDQRGAPRPLDGNGDGSATCDIGAVEVPVVTLTVTRTGAGSGAVTGSGVDCGSACQRSYAIGRSVSLMATAAPGSAFAGWSGACTGSGACQVSMDAAKTVTAAFQPATVGVTVSRPSGPPSSGGPSLTATLSARASCGPINHIEFGAAGVPFSNAKVTIAAPAGGPADQTTGFTYTPPAGATSVSLTVQRVVQSGDATVNPIRFFDGCGEWRTFVGGGPDAFR